MKSNVLETLTGAIVIAVAVLFFIFAYRVADLGVASGAYKLDARFAQVGGLVTGADVRISGIKVGTVVGQTLDAQTYEAIVSLAIEPGVEVPNDTSAQIASEGLLGGSYVSLQPGGSETMLAGGETIEYTQGSVDLMGLIGQAIFGSKD
jgi:phospholipid/cholesterol/gamma-HCH transport system substrate-binding protein